MRSENQQSLCHLMSIKSRREPFFLCLKVSGVGGNFYLNLGGRTTYSSGEESVERSKICAFVRQLILSMKQECGAKNRMLRMRLLEQILLTSISTLLPARKLSETHSCYLLRAQEVGAGIEIGLETRPAVFV